MRFRRAQPAQPGQGFSRAASLRRDGPPSRQRQTTAASRPAALLMSDALKPGSTAKLAAAIAASTEPLEIIRTDSKRKLRRPVNSGQILDLSLLSGITLYEPDELMLTAGAGTRLAEIEQTL